MVGVQDEDAVQITSRSTVNSIMSNYYTSIIS